MKRILRFHKQLRGKDTEDPDIEKCWGEKGEDGIVKWIEAVTQIEELISSLKPTRLLTRMPKI